MPSIDVNNATATEGVPSDQDLGPLAWVLDELRKSLDGAVKAMRRFVRETELASESDLASLDVGALRMARQQLHQASGALEMVGLAPPALVLRAMESAVQKFVQRPDLCTGEATAVIERAGFALIEYLESVLDGKPASAVALFPQYRDAQALAGAERVHPADLWPLEHRFREPENAVVGAPLPYGAQARARLDAAVLKIVKSGDLSAATSMRDTCLGLVAAQSDPPARAFWKICAGFFEALGKGLLSPDVYVKRVASRVLMQYATLAKGDAAIADRLVQDLLFYCAQAQPAEGDVDAAPALQAVRKSFELERFKPVDYETARFGRFDPALLAQARKRIASATETWSALAGGDRNKLKPAADQFSLVCDSLRKLHPGNERLADGLTRALEATALSGEPPSPALAMEVATSVLYLQAAFEELDAADGQMEMRAARLAQRLDAVVAGAEPEPLELWMEELYRRVSDKQTMGSVVDELRATLGTVEKSLDQFFRNPQDTEVLAAVPGHLAQMRGVLSVLGLDQASLAVVRMRDTIERLLINETPPDERQPTFERLGNSLGALGFLIDMLSYQPAMARNLFVYDEELGELRMLVGKPHVPAAGNMAQAPVGAQAPVIPAAESAAPASEVLLPDFSFELRMPQELSSEATALPTIAIPAPLVQAPEMDDELLDVFLEEVREVVGTGLAAIDLLADEPANLREQATLRRAFHTLKGSSRLVGLNEFGEASWAMEQVLNAWLAEQKPMQPDLLQLSSDCLQALGRWADDIAAGSAGVWDAQIFRSCADAMRLEGRLLPLAPPVAPLGPVETDPAALQDFAKVADGAQEVSDTDLLPLRPLPEIAPTDAEVGDATHAAVPLMADFEDTEIGSGFHHTAPATEAAAATEAEVESEGIDFSAFTEALNDAPAASVVLNDGLPDLDLPGLEPMPAVAEGAGDAADVSGPDTEGAVGAPRVVDAEFVAMLARELESADAGLQAGSAQAPREPVAVTAELPEEEAPADEAVKVIDTLRIAIPLYNVYLNEADEWSRRLVTLLQEWALELHEPLPDAAVVLAHSLAGSSATVGFTALSEMARVLEHALQHVQLQSAGTAEQADVFMAAAEDIRRLLHQFAAGFLKDPSAQVLQQLHRILATEVVTTLSPPEEEFDGMAGAPEIALAAPAVEDLREPVPSQGPTVQAAEGGAAGYVAPALSLVAGEHDQRIDDAMAHAVFAGSEVDDAIDAIDVIDPDLFPIFEEEAAELLPQLGGALRQWASRPDNLGARSEVLRALHTLKGSSRLAGAMRLGEMAHRLESLIEQLDLETLTAGQIEPLLANFDALQANLEFLRVVGGQAAADAVVALPAVPSDLTVSATGAGAIKAPASEIAPAVRLRGASQLAPVHVAANQSVRVRAQLLDRLVNQAGEVMISRSRLDARMGQFRSSLADLSGNLDRLRQQLRDIELQAESQMQSRLALSKDSAAGFDPLEFDRFTRVQELTRMMAESVNDVATVQRNLQRAMEGAEDDLVAQGRQARELQRDLLRTRMVMFEGIAERLYAVVRQSSKEAGKQIKLDITGGSIEMDRGVLDRMTPAFEHLLRNCVGHGIEDPEVRVAAGKPATGTISVNLRSEGNDVSVEFRDDGAGLDLPRIREKALAQGVVQAGTDISDAEAANLIFLPGLSTASEVTGLSGRGIGMDVVRSEVNALGGRIETSTQAGKGSAFRLVLPLTTAVTQVVMLRAGDLAFGVPANVVEVVRRTPAEDLEAAYRAGFFDDGNEPLPFYWAGALLQASARSNETAGKTRPVVIFRSASQRIALHVDEVLGNQEVVVKNLGPQLSRLPGLAGMSVLASGAVVLIYNPVALSTVYGDQVRAASAALPAVLQDEGAGTGQSAAVLAGPSQVPLVLVVDDSITVRRVTQRLLQREGYRVALAADGLQALERLQEERPTVVLSDIEMPRMDGFDLARNIRAEAALRELPIIMITSRIAEKHREHAKELGVNHYLGKPYSDEELLSLIRHYARLEATAEA